MGEIKSASEIAREKIEKLGEITAEERLKWKYTPEGEKLAALYLKDGRNLVAELNKYEEAARKYVVAGINSVLVRNISLPRNDLAKKTNKRAIDGLRNLKTDKAAVENVFTKMGKVLDHYVEQGEQQRSQAYESLKADFEAKVQQAMQQQLGVAADMKIDVERQPQFQQEWQKVQAQLDLQYVKLIDEYKQELATIA